MFLGCARARRRLAEFAGLCSRFELSQVIGGEVELACDVEGVDVASFAPAPRCDIADAELPSPDSEGDQRGVGADAARERI